MFIQYLKIFCYNTCCPPGKRNPLAANALITREAPLSEGANSCAETGVRRTNIKKRNWLETDARLYLGC